MADTETSSLAPLAALIVDGVTRNFAAQLKAPPGAPKVWLDPAEASTYLGVHVVTLSNWRKAARGPRWYRINKKYVRYRISDLDQWIVSGAGGDDATS
jgi:hypothetical protein